MCNLSEFLETNPRSSKSGEFEKEQLAVLSSYSIPSDIITFLSNEGISTYRNGFLSTTLPQEHFQLFSAWGLEGDKCFAFLKTAFGSLCFDYKDKIYQLDPISGYLYKGRFGFCDFMNLLATMDSFMESGFYDIYLRIEKKKELMYDEIYSFVPALPLGGSFEESKTEVVKMKEHLFFLAQLFNNKAKQI